MPLVYFNLTCQLKNIDSIVCKIKHFAFALVMQLSLVSCGALSWYSIEQTPADSISYLKDGVFVSGDYIQSAIISEIDGKPVGDRNKKRIKVSTGERYIKVLCEEASGEFNSLDFKGKAKILVLDAKIQRTYRVRCKPFTHWWIEDIENGKIVAGEEYI